jgi:hypothetical protein
MPSSERTAPWAAKHQEIVGYRKTFETLVVDDRLQPATLVARIGVT